MRFMVPLIVTILSLSAAAADSPVGLAELAEVDPRVLEELQGTEFEVFLAEVDWRARKIREEAARRALQTVKRETESGELNLDAARAEEKAARAANDPRRLSAAELALRNASHEREGTALLIQWKEKEVKAGRADVEVAKLRLALAETRRDLARARLLQAAQAPSSVRHSVADYEKSALKAQRNYDNALARAGRAAEDADRVAREWERHTGNERPAN